MVLSDIQAKAGSVAETPGTWGAVRVRSSSEFAVADRIRARGGIAFLPTVKVRQVRRGKAANIDRAIYPTYLFAAWGDEYERHEIRRTRDVVDLHFDAGDRGQARLVRELTALETALAVDPWLDVDDWAHDGVPVRVTYGPLMGIEGRVTRRRGRDVLQVGITMFGQAVELTLDRAQVEPL